MARIGIVGPAYSLNDRAAATQRCVNLFPQFIEVPNEPSRIMLRSTPGLVSFATVLADTPIRAAVNVGNGLMLVVAGTDVYTVTTAGTVSSIIGTLNTSQGIVPTASNGLQIMLVDGQYGYYYTIATNTLTQIADVDFPGGTTVAFVDGYFVVNDPDTQNIYISGQYDASTWNALDFAAAEGDPDNVVSLAILNSQIWAFGESTVEPFYNSGNADFPFARVSGALIEKGCSAPYSVAKCDNSLIWLSNLGVIYRSQGYQAQRISTHAIEESIARYTTVSDAIAFSYEQEGHSFYILTFPTESVTWCYDAATNMWHERAEFSEVDTGRFDFRRWRGNCLCYFNDQIVVGDFENGKVYTLDLDSCYDNGTAIIRMRRTPHARAGNLNRIYHKQLTLTMETGVNSMTPAIPMPEPQIMLRWSNDAGYTWGNELWRSLGAQGHYGLKIDWQRLGMARSRVYEIRISDAARVSIMDDDLEVEAGFH